MQWATGNIGTRSLRAVIEHPDMQLAGVYVHSADKAGRDAGELCGLGEATGAVATNGIDDIVKLGADCVLYLRQGCDVDELSRLLESGANVVTTRGEFHHPAGLDPAVRARIEDACTRGGTSLHSTGSSPGGSGKFAVASRTVEILAGTIEAGTVAAQRMIVTGMRDGRPPTSTRPGTCGPPAGG